LNNLYKIVFKKALNQPQAVDFQGLFEQTHLRNCGSFFKMKRCCQMDIHFEIQSVPDKPPFRGSALSVSTAGESGLFDVRYGP
jgi:hypothetical protein